MGSLRIVRMVMKETLDKRIRVERNKSFQKSGAIFGRTLCLLK